jgi:glucose-1-phosphate thymidylyltransferase
MAGRGSRLRPHSLTVPKPLLPVAGTPIVNQLVSEIAKVVDTPIDEIAFVLGDPAYFGSDVEQQLTALAHSLGAEATIYRQEEPLGTGHAIMCAADSLSGPAVVAYADTLIRADLTLDPKADAVIWVKQVANPSAYGVVQLNDAQQIVGLVEKPETFVSDQAVIGIYYFKDIGILKDKLTRVVDRQLLPGQEYQINEGILAMMEEGYQFYAGVVKEWMDCGNPQITLDTNSQMLKILEQEEVPLVAPDLVMENSELIPPCYIGERVVLKNSKVGPYVALGAGTQVYNSVLSHSLVQQQTEIHNAHLERAMLGNNVYFDGKFTEISIGDYSTLK